MVDTAALRARNVEFWTEAAPRWIRLADWHDERVRPLGASANLGGLLTRSNHAPASNRDYVNAIRVLLMDFSGADTPVRVSGHIMIELINLPMVMRRQHGRTQDDFVFSRTRIRQVPTARQGVCGLPDNRWGRSFDGRL